MTGTGGEVRDGELELDTRLELRFEETLERVFFTLAFTVLNVIVPGEPLRIDIGRCSMDALPDNAIINDADSCSLLGEASTVERANLEFPDEPTSSELSAVSLTV